MTEEQARVRGGAASVAMLLAISSFNVLPTLNRALHGEVAAIGLAVVQIAFTIILAIIPFVSSWDAKTRKRLTILFMIGNGAFAFQNFEHWGDDGRTELRQHRARSVELTAKKDELEKLGKFTVADDSQVAIAQANADNADKDKATAKASADAAEARFAACKRNCTKLENESQRLDGEAKKKETEATAAHNELQKLSGWRTLTKKAEPISARIDALNEEVRKEKLTGDDSQSWLSEILEKGLHLFYAGLIEAGNRYGPEGVFVFILGLAARTSNTAEREPVHGKTGPNGPSKTPSPRKTRKRAEPVQGGATVINMDRSKVVHGYRSMNDLDRSKVVHDPMFSGMGQREIANHLGWSKSAVQRAKSHKPGAIHAGDMMRDAA